MAVIACHVFTLLVSLGFMFLIAYGGYGCSSTENQVWACSKSCRVAGKTRTYSCIGPCGGNHREKVCEDLCGYKSHGVPRCACSQGCESVYDNSYNKNYITCKDATRTCAGKFLGMLIAGSIGLFFTLFLYSYTIYQGDSSQVKPTESGASRYQFLTSKTLVTTTNNANTNTNLINATREMVHIAQSI